MRVESFISILTLYLELYLNFVRSSIIHSNPENSFELLKGFDECMIFILNFKGIDIPFNQIFEPVILLRYFSFFKDYFVYPFEVVSRYNITIIRVL